MRKDIVHSGHYNKYHLPRDTVTRLGEVGMWIEDAFELRMLSIQASTVFNDISWMDLVFVSMLY